MTALFSTPKIKVPPPIKLPPPANPPPVTAGAGSESAFLRSRGKKGTGLSGLILTPLGAGGLNSTMPQANKDTLGS